MSSNSFFKDKDQLSVISNAATLRYKISGDYEFGVPDNWLAIIVITSFFGIMCFLFFILVYTGLFSRLQSFSES